MAFERKFYLGMTLLGKMEETLVSTQPARNPRVSSQPFPGITPAMWHAFVCRIGAILKKLSFLLMGSDNNYVRDCRN